jgi:transcriptional regulator with XRE-family HTH domain
MKYNPDTRLGERLRHFRESAGLSQRELAERLGIHHSNIGYWERSGNLPGPETLVPMAKTLGVTVTAIIGEDKRSSRMTTAPSGRARLAFDAVARLPKRQQQKIVDVVEAFVAQHMQTRQA